MISIEFPALLVRSGDIRCNAPVGVKLIFHPDDPFAVTAVFRNGDENPVWQFALELLYDALTGPEGRPDGPGDVRFGRQGTVLRMCLKSDDGHADIILPVDAIESFLDEIQATDNGSHMVIIDDQMNAFLEEVLGS